MDVALVVRRANKAILEFEYLTLELEWSPRPQDAYQYATHFAFTDAEDHNGTVYLRFANGHETPVSYNQMFHPTQGVIQ